MSELNLIANLVRVSELAKEVGYSQSALISWAERGHIPLPTPIGTAKFYSREQAEEVRSYAVNKIAHSPVRYAAQSKSHLLDLARSGANRPDSKSRLNIHLKSYTSPSSHAFDAKFNSQIRALRPDWFTLGSKPDRVLTEIQASKIFWEDTTDVKIGGSAECSFTTNEPDPDKVDYAAYIRAKLKEIEAALPKLSG